MWILCLVLLVLLIVQAFRRAALVEALWMERRRANREASLRAATELAFCGLVEEQLGDHLRGNRRRVVETEGRFSKS